MSWCQPDLVNPGNQTASGRSWCPTATVATDPNDDDLSFTATGLPPGLEVELDTGVISGIPTTVGVFNIVVTASDGVNADNESFNWTIAQATATFTLNPIPAPAPGLAGSEVTLEASVTGGTDLQYKWDFDDGTAPTA